ncbi:MAG: TonB-dependent receptor [Verrucomicrobiota bacterium]
MLLNAPGIDILKPLSVDNPYNPYGSRFYSPTGAPNADGTPRLTGAPQPITLLALSFQELEGEKLRVTSGVYRGVAGLRGKLGEGWSWEVGALHTRAYTADVSPLAIRETAFAQSLLRNDANAFNPFGHTFRVANGAVVADRPYVNPPSALDPLVQVWRRDGMSAITSGDWRIGGPLLRYWGNTAFIAVGGEARYEEFSDRRPAYVGTNPASSGLNTDDNDFVLFSPKPNSSGTRDVLSGYVETALPLVGAQNNIPLARSLELTASARYERYSDFGSTTRPKVGFNYHPWRGLLLRASFNKGFTAPNLPTLYAPSQFSVDTAPGATDTYRNQAGLSDATYPQRYYATGNPKLKPTTSEGRSAGFVLEVPKVTGLTLTADYWQIDQQQIVGGRSVSQILNSDAALLQAYVQSQVAAGQAAAQVDLGSGTANYKGDPAVVRFAPDANDIAAFAAANAGKPAAQQAPVTGKIFSRYAPYENIAEGFASGVDVSLAYRLPALPLGRLALSTDWSYLIRSNQSRTLPGAGAVATERMNVDGTTRWRGTGTVTWRKEAWSAGLSAYYTGSYADSTGVTTAAAYEALGAPSYLSRQFSDGSFVYRYVVSDVISYNAQVGRSFGAGYSKWLRGSSIRLGVVNLTDRRPPLAAGNFGYSAAVHGGLYAGRTWTLELSRQL